VEQCGCDAREEVAEFELQFVLRSARRCSPARQRFHGLKPEHPRASGMRSFGWVQQPRWHDFRLTFRLYGRAFVFARFALKAIKK
jgi:hypothetical protein